jgi:hypothetical protein
MLVLFAVLVCGRELTCLQSRRSHSWTLCETSKPRKYPASPRGLTRPTSRVNRT